MIKTECCAFCGKKLTEANKNEINGEHIFPAFACKKDFGKSKASSLLQEQIKVSVCKECNTKYGTKLEASLSKIIDGLNGKTPRYAFRTEEALCLLDYIDKTRVLLQHIPKKEPDKYSKLLLNTAININNLSKINQAGRQVFILRAYVPDGVYYPIYSTKDCSVFRTKLGFTSSAIPSDFVSTIAVCIDNIAIIGMNNLRINEELGFPGVQVVHEMGYGYSDGKNDVDLDALWKTTFWDRNNAILLAQPGIYPKGVKDTGIMGDYERNHKLTTKHDGYEYAIYFACGTNDGWLAKNSTESGAKGVKFDLTKQYSYDDFMKIFDDVSKVDIIEHISSNLSLRPGLEDIWKKICDDVLGLHLYYSNILTTRFTANNDFLRNMHKFLEFHEAKKLIDALNLLSQGDDANAKEFLLKLKKEHGFVW